MSDQKGGHQFRDKDGKLRSQHASKPGYINPSKNAEPPLPDSPYAPEASHSQSAGDQSPPAKKKAAARKRSAKPGGKSS